MTVDWFTLIAQIINFLILVALLKRFLYGPIIQAMEQRRADVARRVEEAREKQQQAEEEAAAYRRQREGLEERVDEMLDQAAEEAEQRRQELLEQARHEVERTRQRWEEALQREQEDVLGGLRHRLGQEVVEISRRVLRDLADADLQERIVRAFLTRLADISEEDRQALVGEGATAGRRLQVRSAFELSEEWQSRVRSAIREELAPEAEIAFKVDEEILCGVELHHDGVKVGWSVEAYLEDLQRALRRALGGAMEELSG